MSLKAFHPYFFIKNVKKIEKTIIIKKLRDLCPWNIHYVPGTYHMFQEHILEKKIVNNLKSV